MFMSQVCMCSIFTPMRNLFVHVFTHPMYMYLPITIVIYSRAIIQQDVLSPPSNQSAPLVASVYPGDQQYPGM